LTSVANHPKACCFSKRREEEKLDGYENVTMESTMYWKENDPLRRRKG
jgi:hypothetical protein